MRIPPKTALRISPRAAAAAWLVRGLSLAWTAFGDFAVVGADGIFEGSGGRQGRGFVSFYESMNGWMDGWRDGGMEGWRDGEGGVGRGENGEEKEGVG